MNRMSVLQVQRFLLCFARGVVCPNNYITLEIYSIDNDKVVKKKYFLRFDCLLLSSSIMNSGFIILFRHQMPHSNMPDVRFNPHKPTRGSVQQSLSEM